MENEEVMTRLARMEELLSAFASDMDHLRANVLALQMWSTQSAYLNHPALDAGYEALPESIRADLIYRQISDDKIELAVAASLRMNQQLAEWRSAPAGLTRSL